MTTALADHLWQSTWVVFAAALAAWLLRGRQAKVRFWVWFAASAKFLIPFSLLVNFGARTFSASELQTAFPVQSWASPTAILAVQPFEERLSATAGDRPRPSGLALWEVTLAAVWIFGSGTLAHRRWREWQQIRSALRSSTVAPIESEIEVRYCSGLVEPSVAGWLRRPVLLLPQGICAVLDEAQLRAVLIHEQCHAQRMDNALAALHMLVEVCFWFHPLVWLIGARLLAERERACDEEVLRKGIEPFVYAAGILAVCKHYARSPLTAASGVTGWSLKERIEEIMTNRRFRNVGRGGAVALGAAGLGILSIPFLAGMLNAPLLFAQRTSTEGPRFESVSIRKCDDLPATKRGRGYVSSRGLLDTGCMPLADEQGLGLIQRAYVRFGVTGVSSWPTLVPVSGRPEWFESDLYQVVGKASENTPQEILEGPMLRAALEDRFRLSLHEESPEVAVYALVVQPGGPRLNAFSDISCLHPPDATPWPQPPAGQRYCAVRVGSRPPAVDAEGVGLGDLSKLLSLVLDKPVVDKTGLGGRFAIHFAFAPDAMTPRFLAGNDLARFATDPAAGAKPIAAALAELGLRLEATGSAQKMLVIDHVERPAVD